MKKILSIIAALVLGVSVVASTPVMAEDSKASVSILESCATDNGKGSSIFCVLNFVVDIMTIGIGILGVIGITIVGIQYLTAGGSEEKTRKAKRRMFEIVIGLVAYVLIYAALKWLLPTFGG
ncbi:hypothetical protein [Candidatus Nanosyncoccus alces]|uniref:TrbC/VIRB2 family protein n=1 Tax=Candidatus Nanosyncoccus alces TaxID=2171997 RepID=A0ABY0FLH2_9BACT|nr:hypothetical protein [Candidatus Nanosyncoccus alces]RYC74629.1 hypothetical protein G3RUM_00495 [Candidatus Nanosyncoccus alces]